VRRTVAAPLDFVWQCLVDDPAALVGVAVVMLGGCSNTHRATRSPVDR
jgi:hypothetical protein